MIKTIQLGDLCELIKSYKNEDKGDLHIAHGCNCLVTQGGGIAASFRQFPEIYDADIQFSNMTNFEESHDKIGLVAPAKVSGKSDINVYNCYTQDKFSPRDVQLCNYAGIGSAFLFLNEIIRDSESKILYIPYIGAGLAGGKWEIISCIINDATPDIDVVLVEFVKGITPKPQDDLPIMSGDIVNGRYIGNVYNDERYSDGTEIITSTVRDEKVVLGDTYIVTNNTIYLKAE